MGMKIKANTLIEARFLAVDDRGVTFCQTWGLGGRRKFRFDEIDLILLSEDHVLTFRAHGELFSIPTTPGKKKHDEAIAMLVREVGRTAGA